MLVPGQPTSIIAVMGVTGSGKSTFVNLASGNDEAIVGHSLEACTQKLMGFEFNYNDHNFILVDTPGFNDTYKSDTEVLDDIAGWLELTYRQNTKLTGILYLHRITDVRMDGSGMRNLRMFRKLCGDDPMKNVIILSTFWGQIPEDKAIAHEQELQSKASFWGSMIEHGAEVRRFDGTQQSALETLMTLTSKSQVTLDIQRELVDEEKRLGETAAGNAVNEELHRLEKKYLEELERIQQENAVAMAQKDVKMEQVLRESRQKMEERLDKIHSDQEILREERREDLRRIETENKRKIGLLKQEYDSKLQKQHLESERLRDEDKAGLREQMRNMSLQSDRLSAQFRGQIEELQASGEAQLQEIRNENETLREAVAQNKGKGNRREKIVNLVATGVMAAIDPYTIPVALASLYDFVYDFQE